MDTHTFLKQLTDLENTAKVDLEDAQNIALLREVEIAYLGRKSVLSQLLKSVKDLPVTDRAEAGAAANAAKKHVEDLIKEAKQAIQKKNTEGMIDVTAPGIVYPVGHLHPITLAIREITDIFKRIGFYRVRYPEVEWDWYAFGALNFPEDHPARDDWETIFIDTENVDPKYEKRILTPHTSSGQVREMEKGELPIRMMNISKCTRRQQDVSHLQVFHQFEGLMIDKNITIAHLKGVIDYFVREFYGPDRKTRIRPYNFKFTEPSFEVDISCSICGGKGCRLCKEGWLEIGGAGMVHPKVLENGGIDYKQYSGFAFGWGVERNKIMQKGMNIPDIRLLYQGDIRFLKQF